MKSSTKCPGAAHVDGVISKKEILNQEQADLLQRLPQYIKTLVGNGYAKRVFYFEIVECLRKLAIVCVPVFFDAGSTEQLLFALVVTFCTFGIYSNLTPDINPVDQSLALIAQVIIFFNLISSLAQPMGIFMDVVLTTLLAGFTAASFFLSVYRARF